MTAQQADRSKDHVQAGGSGGWVTPDVSYIDPSRRFCAYCGRPIARRYWGIAANAELAYCDDLHAARHTTYPLKMSEE